MVAKTVRHEVESFAHADFYPIIDMRRQTYIVITLPNVTESLPARMLLIARVVADWVIIYEDATERPLVDSLLQKGIPRERIVLVYNGEPLPDFTSVLAPLVKREVSLYAGKGFNVDVYPILDDEHLTYAIVDVPHNRENMKVTVVNMARVVGDRIIIDEERVDDKPLYEALIHNAGIPREQIILAYAGETLPDEKEQTP
jgi:sulfur carrier protein ThiS